MKTYLGIDGGASSGRWCLVDDAGKKVAAGTSGPIDGHIYREESRIRLLNFFRNIKDKIKTRPASAHIGLTGAPESREAQSDLRDLIFSVFGEVALEIENDVYLGYRATFGTRNGIFLYAGTGSIAVYRDTDQMLRRIGGWGYLLGDEGGGYWIGKEAVRGALFALEEGMNSAISKAVFQRTDGDNWDSIKKFVYSSSREQIASLAEPILTLAQSGDTEAIEIAMRAAKHLSDLVMRVEVKAGKNSIPVAFSGGIANSSKIIFREIEKKLGREILTFHGDTAHEAALFAREKYSN